VPRCFPFFAAVFRPAVSSPFKSGEQWALIKNY
jgi:hypothetical protein